MNWADENGPLSYQFGYTFGDSGGEPDSVFDWADTPMVDLNLPPGRVSLKARVRDSLGASTGILRSLTRPLPCYSALRYSTVSI
jgi:hypothetical protein